MDLEPSFRRPLALAAVLVLAAAWPAGPLAFLPPFLRWPLVATAAVGALFRPCPRILSLLEHGSAALILLLFALVKVPGLHAGWGDENAYFYMATRMAAGEVPYRDFFFAHPPVHLAVPALVFRAVGFSTGVAQAIPLVAQLLGGLFLWRAARRASPVLGVVALALHLMAYQVLMGASEMNGENLATAFTMAALLAACAGRPLLAGGLGGLAVGTVLYAAGGVGAVAVACALRGRRVALRFGAGLVGTLGAVLGGAWAAGGKGFLESAFGYHAVKAADPGRATVLGASGLGEALGGWLHNLGVDLAGAGAERSLALHAPILCAAAAGAAVLLVALRGRRSVEPPAGPAGATSPLDLALVGGAGAALSAVQQATLANVYPFYSVPAFPWLALLGAYGVWRGWQAWAEPPHRLRWAAIALGAFALQPLLGGWADARAFPEERRRAGERVEYAWRDPEVLVWLAHLGKEIAWEDHRLRGAPVPAYRMALWNKQYAFSTLGEIAGRIRAGSSPDETITGGSTLAPLVALEAGRRMAAGEVDTNQKRFTAGLLDDGELLRRALADRIRFVLASPRSHFTEELMERDPGWSAYFERDAVFLDGVLARSGPVRLVLYRRRLIAG